MAICRAGDKAAVVQFYCGVNGGESPSSYYGWQSDIEGLEDSCEGIQFEDATHVVVVATRPSASAAEVYLAVICGQQDSADWAGMVVLGQGNYLAVILLHLPFGRQRHGEKPPSGRGKAA